MFDKPVQPTTTKAVELPDNQRLAIEALICGQSRAEAAQAAGVTLRSLQRWFHNPDFHSALHHSRREAWSEVTGEVHSAGREAVATLREVLHSDQPRARVLAARALLQLASRALDLESLITRMTQLEADLEAGFGSGNPGPRDTPPTSSAPAAPSYERTSPQERMSSKDFSPPDDKPGHERRWRSSPSGSRASPAVFAPPVP